MQGKTGTTQNNGCGARSTQKDRPEEKMKVLGITGGVGAGKSTVLTYMKEAYQARVLLADQIGRDLQQPGQLCYEKMLDLFGDSVKLPDGTLDRTQIAQIVFADKQLLQKLNEIIHPAVRAEIERQIRKTEKENAAPFVVIEAALLIDAGYEVLCDEIWYVRAEEETRIRRLMKSRGYSEKKVRSIMASQLSDEEFRAGSKLVIDNSSDIVENTFEQIDKGLREHGFL